MPSATKDPKKKTTPKKRSAGKMSMRDAAVQVLDEAGGPLRPVDIIRIAKEKRLIKTSGKTPEATLSAQMSVDVKKAEPLFVHTERGHYGLASRDSEGTKAAVLPNA
jgi:restriction system protein